MNRLQLHLESLRRLDADDADLVRGAAESDSLAMTCPTYDTCLTGTCMTYTTFHSSISRTVTGADAK